MISLRPNAATCSPYAPHLSHDRRQLKGLLLTLAFAKLGESLGKGPVTRGLLNTCGEREPDSGHRYRTGTHLLRKTRKRWRGQINFRPSFVNLFVCRLYPFDIACSVYSVSLLGEAPPGTRSRQPAGDIQFLGSSGYLVQNLVLVWCCICGAT